MEPGTPGRVKRWHLRRCHDAPGARYSRARRPHRFIAKTICGWPSVRWPASARLSHELHDARHLLDRAANAIQPARPIRSASHLDSHRLPGARLGDAILTSLLAEFIEFRLALLLYWANILFLGLILYVSWRYAARAGLVEMPKTRNSLRHRAADL